MANTHELATKIVEYCLAWADLGRFEGKGDHRKLILPSIVNAKSRPVKSPVDHMADKVAEWIDDANLEARNATD